jgi:hypothetical protein
MKGDDEVIRLARQAGWISSKSDLYPPLSNLIKLVVKAERDACLAIASIPGMSQKDICRAIDERNLR